MRHVIILLSLLIGAVMPAFAQLSIGIGLPSINIGINFPVYPQFQQVPDYPVYYAPQVDSNFFFYDGMYWVYQGDNWYASSWYNGPWAMVAPMVVPVFILRVPVRYYRQPPPYFNGWGRDAPPRWGDHWGNDWQRQHGGWDKWNRNSVPAPAPLPTYQQQYSGSKYPSYAQQRTITTQNYHYQPQEPVVQQHYQKYVVTKASAPSQQKPPPPAGQDHGAPAQGDATSKPPKHPPQPKPPSGQDNGAAAQSDTTDRPPKHPPQQKPPSGQDNGAPAQGENIPKPPKHPAQPQPPE